MAPSRVALWLVAPCLIAPSVAVMFDHAPEIRALAEARDQLAASLDLTDDRQEFDYWNKEIMPTIEAAVASKTEMVETKLTSKQYKTFDVSKFKPNRTFKSLARDTVDRLVDQKDMEFYHTATEKRTEFSKAIANYIIRAQTFFSELETVFMKESHRSGPNGIRATKMWRHWLDRADAELRHSSGVTDNVVLGVMREMAPEYEEELESLWAAFDLARQVNPFHNVTYIMDEWTNQVWTAHVPYDLCKMFKKVRGTTIEMENNAKSIQLYYDQARSVSKQKPRCPSLDAVLDMLYFELVRMKKTTEAFSADSVFSLTSSFNCVF